MQTQQTELSKQSVSNTESKQFGFSPFNYVHSFDGQLFAENLAVSEPQQNPSEKSLTKDKDSPAAKDQGEKGEGDPDQERFLRLCNLFNVKQ